MSIHSDRRQFGTEEEREEWLNELKYEYRKQKADDERLYEREYEQEEDK